MRADQTLSLQANDFELFELPEQFKLDLVTLTQRWKALQAQTHPDKFVAADAASKRLAMQWSVRVNEAYQRLRQPISRGAYLAELRGHPVNAEDNTAMPAAFLMQQMAWREALDDAQGDATSLAQLADETANAKKAWLSEAEAAFDTTADTAQAVGAIRALMFIERFLKDVNQQLDALTP
jgi:molecular chaperone HscB